MQICEIKKIIEHNSIHKTFFFDLEMKATAGQFVMIWIPGIDEIPMSLSYIGKEIAITVEKVGEATEALHNMKEGDKVGIRGPYGKGFEIVGRKALFIAGGTGIAPLLPLIKKYEGEKHVVLGARTKELLLFSDELEEISSLHISTDDGSFGFKGFASDLAREIMEKEEFDIVYTCGPEIMMKKVLDLSMEKNVQMQASLERYMKCGVGICDSCAIDGYHVCKDGPVFDSSILAKIKDFGKWKRNEAGKRVEI
ncbi:MAG: dihydroorotate dehydrogenase electron transfer subunit [Thermoplasmata archaeon]|nr:MAG: dihydroorotate dehydrogenase electron transfer subunit [Thermoplasmata archaeon]